MPPRRLDPGEAALWAKVMAGVRPLHPSRPTGGTPTSPAPKPLPARPMPRPGAVVTAPIRAPRQPGPHLDGSWDRRLARGVVSPDTTVDLHGHSLASAHALLNRALGEAIAAGARVLLLITGKPRVDAGKTAGRGAIRAAVHDWIGASAHADHIVSIRTAHPRHGGTGALYLILRRPR
ncbi:Smr/MutS family protein [Sphingomonas sp. CFBP 13720]|uniref:Smr/MutS family protein n=1 Tax=Sphingomonas sp. CFBP 13720 TaxID=2775302 RepID=UPI0031388AC4